MSYKLLTYTHLQKPYKNPTKIKINYGKENQKHH